MSGARIRTAVVGLGTIAQVAHLPNLLEMGDRFEIRAVSDLSPALAETVADALPGAVRWTADWKTLLGSGDLDAILFLTSGAHGAMTLAALEVGLHVFSEKPLCLTRREAAEIQKASRRARRAVTIGYMKTHEPAVRELRSRLSRIGDIRSVTVKVCHPSTRSQLTHARLIRFADVDPTALDGPTGYELERTTEAIGDAAAPLGWYYRNILQGSVIHEASLLRATIGVLPEIDDARLLAAPESTSEPPSVIVNGHLGEGAGFRMEWLWLPDYPIYTETLVMEGTAGRASINLTPPYRRHQTAGLQLLAGDGAGHPVTETFDGGARSAFALELEVFLATIANPEGASDALDAESDIAWLQDITAALARDAGITIGGEAARPI